MNLSKAFAVVGLAVFASLLLTQKSLAATSCVLLHDGVEFRTYLPDAKRFVYVDVKVLPGVYPSVFFIADKNYDAAGATLAVNDPLNRWWTDRSRPFSFTTDRVRIRWTEDHTFGFVTDWFTDNPPKEFVQNIRGIEKVDSHFEGPGANDTNTFAFQLQLDMDGFTDDYFEVSVPAVTYQGATVTPPIVHFERDDNKLLVAKC